MGQVRLGEMVAGKYLPALNPNPNPNPNPNKGSPAIKPPDQETLKGSPLNRLTTTSDEAVHMERVAMKIPGIRTSVHALPR